MSASLDPNVGEVNLFRVKGLIANAQTVVDKALLIEKEISFDSIYTLISMGTSIAKLANSLGVSIHDFEFMLSRTKAHRAKYMEAQMFGLAKGSMQSLNYFKDQKFMVAEEAAAAKHHTNMLKLASDNVNKQSDHGMSSAVNINNIITYRDADDRPPVPDELASVLEGDFEECP